MKEHPILEMSQDAKMVRITVDGRPLMVREGQMIAAALLERGIRINRYTQKRREPRGIFCGIGQCTDGVMIVDGMPNVRTCITPVKEGMVIKTQGMDEMEVCT